jgi:hypothetical protein
MLHMPALGPPRARIGDCPLRPPARCDGFPRTVKKVDARRSNR